MCPQRRTSTFAPTHVESLDQSPETGAALPHPARSPEEDVAGRQLQLVLDQAIGSLEPMYREVLVLRDVEGLSAPEVAEALGLTAEAVMSRLHRARMAVRELVAPSRGRTGPTRHAAEAGEAPVPPGVESSVRAALRRFLDAPP